MGTIYLHCFSALIYQIFAFTKGLQCWHCQCSLCGSRGHQSSQLDLNTPERPIHLKRFRAEAYGALQHVLFMYSDGSELMSSDWISTRTTFTQLCWESWKNAVSKLQWATYIMRLNHRLTFITLKTCRSGLLTLSALSLLISPDIWVVDNFTHLIKWSETGTRTGSGNYSGILV